MSCPHGLRSQPTSCSLCIGATPRIVTAVAGELHIDGEPAGRPLDPLAVQRSYYARRGGKQHGRRRQG